MATLVTFEAVATAAEALVAAGQRASVRAVTAVIGGGSPNTVLKMLGDWKAGRPVVRIKDTELDTRITDAIKAQMQRVAEAAAAEAQEKATELDENLQAMSEAQTKSEQQIETLTKELDEARKQVSDLTEQLCALKADADRTVKAMADQIDALRREALTERQKQEATAATLTRAEVHLEAIPKLEAELKTLKAQLEAERNSKIKAQQAEAVAVARYELTTQHIREASERLQKADVPKAQTESEPPKKAGRPKKALPPSTP